MKDLSQTQYEITLTGLGLLCVFLSIVFASYIISYIMFMSMVVICFGLALTSIAYNYPEGKKIE